MVALLGGSTMAAPPGNDDRGAATTVSGLPFADSVDTTEATSQQNDPDCIPSSHTVWYSFTPGSTRRFQATTTGSDYDTTLTVAHDTDSGLDVLGCNDDFEGLTSAFSWQGVAGETYLIMAGDLGPDGGNLEFQLRVAPPRPTVALSAADRGRVTKRGNAILTGTVRCRHADEADLMVRLRQDFDRFKIRATRRSSVGCGERWTVRMGDPDFRITAGRARLKVRATACNGPSSCRSAFVRKGITLVAE
jgi:hypothetical protein